MTTFLLVHGGLWEDGMDAGRFWHEPGIAAGLLRRGFEVLTPERLPRAPDWTAEAARFTPESSPRTRTKPNRSSTARFNRPEISLTVSGAALSPAVSFATSAAKLSSE